MKYDLTLAKIRNTDFASLYDKFIIGEKLSQKQYEILLAIAICFTNADDINVQQLGYRIVAVCIWKRMPKRTAKFAG